MKHQDIKRHRNKIAKWILVLWAPSFLIFVAYSLSGQMMSPKVPEKDDPILVRSIQNNRRSDEVNAWIAVHILSAQSKCSKQVARHLFSRDGISGIKEKILLVEA